MKKKILIFHYRIGGTDGVSLEIIKRKKLLEDLNFKVVLIGGPLSKLTDYVINLLEFDNPTINVIKKNAFYKLVDFKTEKEFENYFKKIQSKLYKEIEYIILKEKPEYLILHNIFSHGRHIAAAKPFYKLIEKYNLKTISFNHDFYWDRKEYKKTTCNFIKNYLNTYVPPDLSLKATKYIKHIVINSINKKKLSNFKNIDSLIIGDLFDFRDFDINSLKPKKLKKNEMFFNKSFNILNDLKHNLVCIQATRIVERKAIELGFQFIELFVKKGFLRKIENKKLYNGKSISKFSKLYYILTGYSEKDSLNYLFKLIKYSKKIEQKTKNKIKFIFLNYINYQNNLLNNSKNELINFSKFPDSMWYFYKHADFITYPSINEGYGNQFLEGLWYKKLLIVFEYPVFITDLKPLKYFYISLGNRFKKKRNSLLTFPENKTKFLHTQLNKFLKTLLSNNTEIKMIDNFNIAFKNNSYKTQKRLYEDIFKF